MIDKEDYEFSKKIANFMAEAIKNEDFVTVKVTEIKTPIKGGCCNSEFVKNFNSLDIRNCLNWNQKIDTKECLAEYNKKDNN